MNMRKIMSVIACAAVLTLTCQMGCPNLAWGRQLSQKFKMTDSIDSIKLVVGSSRRIAFDYNVPELMVENPDIVQATPVAANEILLSGLKQGLSTITISDPEKHLQTITVEVTVDVRKLEMTLRRHFPASQINVDPLQNGVILSGFVARADQIENVVKVAQDYFPTNVINSLRVAGNQNIAIDVKIYEVSRTKLRKLGVDWAVMGKKFGVVSSVSGLIREFSIASGTVTGAGQNFTSSVINGNTKFNSFIEALEKRNIAKLVAQPTLVTQNGRPAEFLDGGLIPFQTSSGLGSTTIQFRPFGTKLDLVPIVHGQGQLTLEVRVEVSEVAKELESGTGVPGFNVRRVNTGIKMKAGHTLALAGMFSEKSHSEIKGVPKLLDNPVLGPLVRRVEQESSETELLFLLTPRFISGIEPQQVAPYGPGQSTQLPSDHDLLIKGHLEVPRCQNDCPVDDRFRTAAPYSMVPPVQQATPTAVQQPVGVVSPSVRPQRQAAGSWPRGSLSNRSHRPAPASRPRQAKASSGFAWPTRNR